MAVNLSLLGGAGWQFFDNNGIPLAGGLLYTYEAGTTTPASNYTTSAGNVSNTNPVVLNSAGRVAEAIWLTQGTSYKFVLKTSALVTLGTYDNITGSSDPADIYAALAASSGSSLIGFLQAGSGAIATTVQTKLRESVSVLDFGADPTGATDSSAAIQAALNSNADGVSVHFPTGLYTIGTTIVLPTGTAIKITGDGLNPQETTSPVKGSIVKWIGAANGTMFSGNPAADANVSGLTIRDIRFDGDDIASIGFIIGATVTHPQHIYFENVQLRYFASNGTDAALDLAGGSYTKSGVADSTFINCMLDGGARTIRVSSQQLNFFGGAVGGKNDSFLVELGDNSHAKFFGTGFYSGPGNPTAVFGVAGTVGIDGLECYSCWNEGQKGLFGHISPAANVSAYKVTFENQRCALVAAGTYVMNTTGLNTNITWVGGYNDNTALSLNLIDTGSTLTVFNLQSGGLTYSGAGKVVELSANGLQTHQGNGASVPLELANDVSLKGTTAGGTHSNLIKVNADGIVVISDDTAQTLTKLSYNTSGVFSAGVAAKDGVVGVDSTNGWLVFYYNGARYKLVGTAY